jgi:hypothetical protein
MVFFKNKWILPLQAAATSIGTALTTPAAILYCWRKAGGDETTSIWRRNADTRVKKAALYGEAEKRKIKMSSDDCKKRASMSSTKYL